MEELEQNVRPGLVATTEAVTLLHSEVNITFKNKNIRKIITLLHSEVNISIKNSNIRKIITLLHSEVEYLNNEVMTNKNQFLK